MKRVRPIAARLWSDYLMPRRLSEYEAVLELALTLGYQPMTYGDFATQVAQAERVLLLRHDIDSDVGTALRMWDIDRRLGVSGAYFFRLSTWDDAAIDKISAAGWEVGYHYEELATLMKARGACTPEGAQAVLSEAQVALHVNLSALRQRSGLPLDTLASHGDWANRRAGVANTELLRDPAIRVQLGVRLEAYDAVISSRVSARSSDGEVPPGWRPADPALALRSGKRVVEILVHPRHWGAAPLINAKQDLGRLKEETRFRIRRRRSTAPQPYGTSRSPN